MSIELSAILPVDPAVLATILGGIMQSTRRMCWLSMCMCLSALLPQVAPAATFTPTTVAQLISAINTANANGASDIIDLGGLTFTLTAIDNGVNGLPVVLADGGNTLATLAIANGTLVRGVGAPVFRLLEVAVDAALTLDRVTISNGSGSALLNNGLLVIANSTFSGNAGTAGGAVQNANTGSIIGIAGSTFSDNTSTGSGGAIFNGGTIGIISSSTFSGNSATANGGGIHNEEHNHNYELHVLRQYRIKRRRDLQLHRC
ncbi:MAG: FAD-binding oxidoreductase [Betaproteobacteria bacterium]|nr:FAD-binding oxidoreductase [Betaproteobacteria bacterium]